MATDIIARAMAIKAMSAQPDKDKNKNLPSEILAFNNCTWEQIKAIGQQGYINRLGKWCIWRDNIEEVWFEIGDEKTITLSTGETWTLQIWDFLHDDLIDGSGKAPFTIGMKNLTADVYQINTTDTNSGGWENCYFRTTTIPIIFNTLPESLKTTISTVTKENEIRLANNQTTIVNTNDTLFLPSSTEYGPKMLDEGVKYSIFNTEALKKDSRYWTRTSWTESYWAKWQFISTSNNINNVNHANNALAANSDLPVRLAFCV